MVFTFYIAASFTSEGNRNHNHWRHHNLLKLSATYRICKISLKDFEMERNQETPTKSLARELNFGEHSILTNEGCHMKEKNHLLQNLINCRYLRKQSGPIFDTVSKSWFSPDDLPQKRTVTMHKMLQLGLMILQIVQEIFMCTRRDRVNKRLCMLSHKRIIR
jgi:hypothetical protein